MHAATSCANPDPYTLSCAVTEDLTLCADHTYTLSGEVFVENGATLTIEAGARIEGMVGGTLIVARGARLEARGTADAPIVMSCDAPEGERVPGCWGGVMLLGEATINDGICVGGSGVDCDGGHFEKPAEGLPLTDPRGMYGGRDDGSSCGALEYVRVEFASAEFNPGQVRGAVTVAGCGDGTTLRHLQVHRARGDGIGLFGGTAGMDHVVVSGAGDDGIDWEEGWRGEAQFLVLHQMSLVGDTGIESDNLGARMDALPRSSPTLWNVTLCGVPGDGKRGVRHRAGTAGFVGNAIVQNFTAEAMDVNDDATVAQWMDGHLSWSDTYFWSNTASGTGSDFSSENTTMFDLSAALAEPSRNDHFDMDPTVDCNDSAPSYVPATSLPGGTPPAGFDASATYAGAFEPNGTDWTAGWTAFPVD